MHQLWMSRSSPCLCRHLVAAAGLLATHSLAMADDFCIVGGGCGGISVSWIDFDSCLCVTSYDFSAAGAAVIVCDQGSGLVTASDTEAETSIDGSCVGGSAQIYAVAQCLGQDGCGISLQADAMLTLTPSGLTRMLAGTIDNHCCVGTTCHGGPIVAIASAVRAIARASLDSSNCGETLYTVIHGGTVAIPAVDSTTGRALMLVSSGDGDPARMVWLIHTLSGGDGDGVTEGVDGNGNLVGAIDKSYQFSGTIAVDTGSGVTVTDAQLDANGDGRFSERDWHLIVDIAADPQSQTQQDLDKYNLYIEPDPDPNDADGDDPSDDQVIGQGDLDIIRNMLDAGLGAGEFGDWDGDGVVDCDDYSAAPTSPNAVIGDANYRVTFDYDLDGDNDAGDRAAFEALFPTADVAPTYGILDLDDISTFIAAHSAQDDLADVAPPYGVWDLADITAFVAAFGSPCP